MTETQGIKRLGFRFQQALSRDGKFTIYQEDINALNAIAEFIQEKQKNSIIDNVLFGKMYVYLYGQFVTHYKCSAIDNIPQSELHRLLDKDYRVLVQEVADKLNLSELENVIEKDKSIKNYEPMKYEEVAEIFKIMIVSAINSFSPKHLERI